MNKIVFWGMLGLLVCLSCCSVYDPRVYQGKSYTYGKWDARIAMDNNICKQLKGEIGIIPIFVTGIGEPWTDVEIEEMRNGLDEAKAWLEQQAASRDIDLSIEVSQDHFTISADQMKKSKRLCKGYSYFKKKDIKNYIAGKPNQQAVVFFVNGNLGCRLGGYASSIRAKEAYFYEHLIIFNSASRSLRDRDVSKYGFKYSICEISTVIAHEMLHLFGAMDLYYPHSIKQKNIHAARKYFPNSIMDAFDCLDEAKISELTEYLIGWRDTLDPKYERLLNERG